MDIMDSGKGIPTIVERALDAVCLVASFGILHLLPQNTDVVFYLLFGISVFLFCIGFFRLLATFSEPTSPEGARLVGLIFMVAGAAVNTCGLYCVYSGNGTGRSIAIATLMLIEALVFYGMAGGLVETPEIKRMISIGYRIVAILLIAAGLYFVIRDHFSTRMVILGTMLLIEAICLWNIKFETTRFKGKGSEE